MYIFDNGNISESRLELHTNVCYFLQYTHSVLINTYHLKWYKWPLTCSVSKGRMWIIMAKNMWNSVNCSCLLHYTRQLLSRCFLSKWLHGLAAQTDIWFTPDQCCTYLHYTYSILWTFIYWRCIVYNIISIMFITVDYVQQCCLQSALLAIYPAFITGLN